MEVWEITGFTDKSMWGFKATVNKDSLEEFIISNSVRSLTSIRLREVYTNEP